MQRNAGDPEAAMAANFAHLVTDGETWFGPIRMLVEELSGGPLQLDEYISNEQVCDILKSKHPEATPLYEDAVLPGNPSPPPHSVRFEALTREVILKTSLHTSVALDHLVLMLNAESWCHM